MDRRGLLKAALRWIGRPVKWWRRLSIAALAIVALVYVPLVRFAPGCGPDPDHLLRITATMSPEYRETLKSHFDLSGIGYWEIAGRVWVTAWTWITGVGNRDGDDLHNAYKKAAIYLGRDRYVVERDGTAHKVFPHADGRVIAGKVYRVPDHVKALRDPWTGRTNYDNCEYMYGVVTGQPVPTEMFAQWPSWAKKASTWIKRDPPSAGW